MHLLIFPLMLSPWDTIIGAPAGSSVRAQGLMIVAGMPLSRTTSSPLSLYVSRYDSMSFMRTFNSRHTTEGDQNEQHRTRKRATRSTSQLGAAAGCDSLHESCATYLSYVQPQQAFLLSCVSRDNKTRFFGRMALLLVFIFYLLKQ